MTENAFLRPLAATDLETVRHWRNHPSVRDHMFSRQEISAEAHRVWFERCRQDPARVLLVFECDGAPKGFVQFSPSLSAGVADWGFYTAPDAATGTGRRLGAAALAEAFGRRGLRRLCGQAIAANTASIRLHAALGFSEEGRLRRHFFDGTDWHDLVLFGLLDHEWQQSPRG